MGIARSALRDDMRPGGASRVLERDFIFAPSEFLSRNHPAMYFLSFAVFLGAAYLLGGVAGAILIYWGKYNQAIHRFVEVLQANDLSKLAWEGFFAQIGITFLIFIAALAFALRVVHARGLLSVLTDRNRFDWGRMALGFVIYAALLVGPFLAFVWNAPYPMAAHFELLAFLKLLLISSAVLLIQTSAEEMVFRGYLSQFVASFTTSPLFIVGIPSLLFMLVHLENPELKNDPGVLAFYFGFGVFMSLIAIRDRAIEFTIGAHFANNLVIAVLVRPQDSLFQTPTLFVLPTPSPAEQGPILPGLMAPILYYFITALFVRRRRSN